ncbi:Mss4-like protein [Peziza echinospora]|nr:Mss4-like protein [Peziza echinospora]
MADPSQIPDPSTSPLTATCACGAITLTLPHPPSHYTPNLCFCNTCAMGSSSSYQPNIVLPTSELKISDPQGVLKAYELGKKDSDLGLRKIKYFCGTCGVGTHSWIEAIAELTVVKAGGTLGEQRKYLKPPARAIYVKYKPDHIILDESIEQFTAMSPPPKPATV